jgi:hypothetical protein
MDICGGPFHPGGFFWTGTSKTFGYENDWDPFLISQCQTSSQIAKLAFIEMVKGHYCSLQFG